MRIIIFLFISANIFAQKYNTDFKYSSLISGKNHSSATLFSVSFNYEFDKYDISVGPTINGLSDRLFSNAISHQPDFPFSLDLISFSIAIGISARYYPNSLNFISFIKPFIGAEVGLCINNYMRSTNSNTPSCEESYIFDVPNDIYTNFNVGTIFFPKNELSLIFEINYQFRQPKITYETPICNPPYVSHKYTESVDLNILVWGAGLRVNF